MIRLTIPPDPTSMAVLRASAGAIAARASLTLDQVDDVRMAVEEAAMLLLPAETPITLAADPDAETFEVRVSAPSAHGIEVVPDSLPWLVLSGVTDQVDVEQQGDVLALRLRFARTAVDR